MRFSLCFVDCIDDYMCETYRKRNVEGLQNVVFFDGQSMHTAFYQYSKANLKAACQ